MRYIKGPYIRREDRPPPTTKLVTSRSIDFGTRRYVLDDEGNDVGMDDTAQRVIMAHSYALPEPPEFLSDDALQARAAAARSALAELEAEGAIEVDAIEASTTAPGAGREVIHYRNVRGSKE